MKKITLSTMLLALVLIQSARAQKEITLKGVSGKVSETNLTDTIRSKDLSITFGQPLILKITGVNPFLHTIQVLDSVVSIKYEIPTEVMSVLFKGYDLGLSDKETKKSNTGGSEQNLCTCQCILNKTFQLLLATSQNPNLNEEQLKFQAITIINNSLPKDKLKPEVLDSTTNVTEELFSYLSDQKCYADSGSADSSNTAYVESIQAITKLFNAMMRCSFTHSTDVVYPKGDEHEFTVRISPIDSLKYGSGFINRNQHLRYWTKNKFNINLSGGIGLSGLQDNTFSLLSSSGIDSTSQKIVLQNRETFRYGAAITAHFYSRLSYNVNPAFSLGILYDSGKRVTPTAGVSLIFGHRSRLIVTGGVAMGAETRLKKGYDEETFFENLGEDALTREVNRVTWYLGLTFNTSVSELLTGRKKTN